jgi:hypothetical protein
VGNRNPVLRKVQRHATAKYRGVWRPKRPKGRGSQVMPSESSRKCHGGTTPGLRGDLLRHEIGRFVEAKRRPLLFGHLWFSKIPFRRCGTSHARSAPPRCGPEAALTALESEASGRVPDFETRPQRVAIQTNSRIHNFGAGLR